MEISIECTCGTKLVQAAPTVTRFDDVAIQVEPCGECNAKEYDRGLSEGQES